MTFEKREQAIKAISEMNNKVIIGKTVQVSLDEQVEPKIDPYRMFDFTMLFNRLIDTKLIT